MQRKNNILRSSRSGMAMIMAIAVIVILATIMALSVTLTTQTTKRTADLYLYEQTVLLSKSATEYALLKISKASPCSETALNFTHDNIYDINITMKYIFTDTSVCSDSNDIYTTVSTEEQNGSVLIDVTVTTNNEANIGEPIRYFKRSINKL